MLECEEPQFPLVFHGRAVLPVAGPEPRSTRGNTGSTQLVLFAGSRLPLPPLYRMDFVCRGGEMWRRLCPLRSHKLGLQFPNSVFVLSR